MDVFEARARFASPHEVELDDGTRLQGAHFVIATGTRPFVPPIPGLQEVPFFTNESFFDEQETAPESLIVLGGGPIGCEMGQVMSRLGVRVTILTDVRRLLPRDDHEASAVVLDAFTEEGIEIVTGCRVGSFRQEASGAITAEMDGDCGPRTVIASRLLVATGRSPNVENLGLEAAGVRFDARGGVPVDASLRTNVGHIYACGDIAGPYRFTHTADYQARLVVRNILLPAPLPRAKADYRYVPWVTYVDPEVAHFGLREEDAGSQGIAVDVHRHQNDDLDRAITEAATPGLREGPDPEGKGRNPRRHRVCAPGGRDPPRNHGRREARRGPRGALLDDPRLSHLGAGRPAGGGRLPAHTAHSPRESDLRVALPEAAMSKTLKLGGILVLIVALVVVFPIGDWIQAGAEWARGQGALGLVVFAALYAVATVFAVPGSALTLIAGGAFGVASGTVAVWFGATAGLALAFLAARLLARDRVARWLSSKPSFAAVDRAVAAEGWKIVFLTRLTPVFPFTVLNYAYGLTGVGFPGYLIASATGILPGTLLYIYLGSSVARTVSGESDPLELLFRGLGLAAFVVVTILITRTARRALREAGVGTEDKS